MDTTAFQCLLNNFENEVIINGASSYVLKHLVKTSDIPVSGCKLYRSHFGEKMGYVVETDMVLTIDYYGYLKKSRGLIELINGCGNIKIIKSQVIHFASIKIEDVVNATDNVEVIVSFPKLKDMILKARGFRKNLERISLSSASLL